MLGRMIERAVTRALEKRSTLENPSTSLAAFILGDEEESTTGIAVSRATALQVPAIWAAVNFLSDTIASLPLQVFRRVDDEREKVPDAIFVRPQELSLNTAVAKTWTSQRWRKHLMGNVLLSGRSITEIVRARNGRVSSLLPHEPGAIEVKLEDGEYVYKLSRRLNNGDAGRSIDAGDVLDIVWMLASDGVTAIDPIAKLKNTIALHLAMTKFASKAFQKGGVPPLVLQGPINTPAAASRASVDIAREMNNAANERRNVLVLPTGHELKEIGFDPEKMQLKDARRFQVEEVARMFNLPPVFLQDLTHGTFSNTEQQDLMLVKHTIRHWLTNLEAEFDLKLPTGPQRRQGVFIRHNVDGLLRGDFRTRMEGLARSVQNAMRTPNEARAVIDLPPLEGGDALVLQQNMTPIGMLGQVQPGTPPNAPPADEPDEPDEPDDNDDGEDNADT